MNASTSVSFTGELHLHAWLAERFEGATSNLSLVSRARQFLALGVGQQGAGDLRAKQKGNPCWTVAFRASMEVRFDKMHQDAMWYFVVLCVLLLYDNMYIYIYNMCNDYKGLESVGQMLAEYIPFPINLDAQLDIPTEQLHHSTRSQLISKQDH